MPISTNQMEALQATIATIAVSGKGILAADESTPTITKRFAALNIESTEETRRAYRELLFKAADIEKYIAGVILYEETLLQKSKEGLLFPELLLKKGILPGIKVDKGLVPLPGQDKEMVTQGLDGLTQRLEEYKKQGARFAKWRAVYSISEQTPSALAIKTNAIDLARYASICQHLGIVPIVEPEVLIDGAHSIEQCFKVSEKVLHQVFNQLYKHHVLLEYVILKPSMVTPGKNAAKVDAKAIANATITVLKRTVPSSVPTINFLSGGQTVEQATENLAAMHQLGALPWNLSFSFARALQEPCMQAWLGKTENRAKAQQAFIERAQKNSIASMF